MANQQHLVRINDVQTVLLRKEKIQSGKEKNQAVLNSHNYCQKTFLFVGVSLNQNQRLKHCLVPTLVTVHVHQPRAFCVLTLTFL